MKVERQKSRRQKKHWGRILGKGERRGAAWSFLPGTLETGTGVGRVTARKPPEHFRPALNSGVARAGAGRPDPRTSPQPPAAAPALLNHLPASLGVGRRPCGPRRSVLSASPARAREASHAPGAGPARARSWTEQEPEQELSPPPPGPPPAARRGQGDVDAGETEAEPAVTG